MTNRNIKPDFKSTDPNAPDYHLNGRTANNNSCCINQIPPPDAVDHDFDGRSRPQPAGGNYTVGAHEIP
jgi:hypothetical protein